eukprot:650015-Ditylum_brightwellii.AAC.1
MSKKGILILLYKSSTNIPDSIRESTTIRDGAEGADVMSVASEDSKTAIEHNSDNMSVRSMTDLMSHADND